MFYLVRIDSRAAAFIKLFDRGIHIVTVVRIVLESVDFVSQSILEGLSEVDVRFMCIERAVRVGCVQKPVFPVFIGYDIDNSAQGIRPEPDRHYATVHFDAGSKVNGNVVQSERTSYALLRHSVNKQLDVLAGKSVQRKNHIRPHSSGFPKFESRNFCQGIRKVLCTVMQTFRINCHRIKGRFIYPAHCRSGHYHFIQFRHLRSNRYIDPYSFTGFQCHFLFYCRIPNGRYNQCVVACCRFQVIQSLFICSRSSVRPFQIYSRKVHHFFFYSRNHSSGNHPSGSPMLRKC